MEEEDGKLLVENRIITIVISVIILLLFFIYRFYKLRTPCDLSLKNVFFSNFIHVSFLHMMYNILALYTLVRLEKRFGGRIFLILIMFFLVTTTLSEFFLRKYIPELGCSIGFSSIIFGLFAWELCTISDFDVATLATITIISITPYLRDNKVALYSHILGAVFGIIASFIFVPHSSIIQSIKQSS